MDARMSQQTGSDSLSILQRIAVQDMAAIGDCLDAYAKLVWSMARRYTKTHEDAEDAVQDIFIDVWKYADRFDARKSPEPAFVALVARRRLIDRLRRAQTQLPTAFFDEALHNRPSDEHKKLQMFLEIRCALKALNTLGAQQKQLVRMAIYGGMSHAEIARTTGLPLGTVKSQIRRSFQKLRAAL